MARLSIQGRWRRSIVFVSGRVTGFMLLVRGSAEYLTDRVGELKEVHSELATTLAAIALNQEKGGCQFRHRRKRNLVTATNAALLRGLLNSQLETYPVRRAGQLEWQPVCGRTQSHQPGRYAS
ncbi:hypothetical protein ACFS07_17935 [Undibacterium arcticum]